MYAPTRAPAADLVRIYLAPGPLSPAALAPAAADATLTTFRAAILAEINARREEAGAAPVTGNAALDDATRRHASYLVTNGLLWDTYVDGQLFAGHAEIAGLPGFWATSFDQRDQLSGYAYPWREDVLRIKAPGNPLPTGPVWTAERVVRTWIDAPLHRRSILDPEVRDIGFGYAQNAAQDPVSLKDGAFQAYVLDVGTGPLQAAPVSLFVYPGDGQAGVPTSWDGSESPDPFPTLPNSTMGYVLTAFPVAAGPEDFESAQLTLVRASDRVGVPVVQSASAGGSRNYCWASPTPLAPFTTYTATLTFKTGLGRGGALRFIGSRTWSFTTGAGSGGGSTTTTTAASTTTTTTASTTTTLPPTTTTTLPATTTTTAPPVVFADVPERHPYRDAIYSIAGRAIVEGRDGPGGTRVFAPDALVQRQQLAKMVVLSLGLTATPSDGAPFTDVPHSDGADLYPDHYIAVAARERIVEGYPVAGAALGLFKPYNSVTRAQLVTMVVRAAKDRVPDWLSRFPVGWSRRDRGLQRPEARRQPAPGRTEPPVGGHPGAGRHAGRIGTRALRRPGVRSPRYSPTCWEPSVGRPGTSSGPRLLVLGVEFGEFVLGRRGLGEEREPGFGRTLAVDRQESLLGLVDAGDHGVTCLQDQVVGLLVPGGRRLGDEPMRHDDVTSSPTLTRSSNTLVGRYGVVALILSAMAIILPSAS